MFIDCSKVMTPQQLGSYAEKMFEAIIAHRHGKEAYLYRFPDTKDVRNHSIGESTAWIKKQPADYLLAFLGGCAFCEIKATENKESFTLSRLRPEQKSTLRKLQLASVDYSVLVLRRTPAPAGGYEHTWYTLDRDFIQDAFDKGINKLYFKNLGGQQWVTGNLYLASAPI